MELPDELPREEHRFRQPECPCCGLYAGAHGCCGVNPAIAIPCPTPGCICQGADEDGCEDCWLSTK